MGALQEIEYKAQAVFSFHSRRIHDAHLLLVLSTSIFLLLKLTVICQNGYSNKLKL